MNLNKTVLHLLLAGAGALSVCQGAIAAEPVQQEAASKRGVLVMAHGGADAWNEEVEKVVAPLRDKFPTELAYGMALRSSLEDATRRLEEQGVTEIAVVRLFISGESFLDTTEVIFGHRQPPQHPKSDAHAHASGHHNSHAAGNHGGHNGHQNEPGVHGAKDPHAAGGHGDGGHHMGPAIPLDTDAHFVISREGVGDSPLIDHILLDRVRALSNDPAKERVLILAHGPGDDEENTRWLAAMRERIQQLREVGPFTQIQCETLREDWPDKRHEAETRIRAFVEEGNASGERVIVVPFRVAGFGPYASVLDGLDYVADELGFCPHPNMTQWLETAAEKCFAEFEALARN